VRTALIMYLLAAACSETTTVHLTFGQDTSAATTAAGTPVAFRCRDADGHFLPSRAVVGTGTGRQLAVAFVVDFFALGGVPSCRPGDIARWCQGESHDCHVIADDANAPRLCFDTSAPLSPTGEASRAMADVLAGLEGRIVTSDAPHEPVIIRVVASAQSCAQLTPGADYAADQLVGCALSCPVQLDSVSGDVLLDLPTISDMCEASVVACAQGTFFMP
jgi:hypothetical protein